MSLGAFARVPPLNSIAVSRTEEHDVAETERLPLQDDERGIEARSSLVRCLGPGFRELGEFLWVGGYMIGGDRVAGRSPFAFGSDAVVGLAIVTQTAGELCAGAALLLEHGNDYGAAALLRQLVEVEYLGWAFAEDEDEAADWLRSGREDRLKRWQPRHMRDRSSGRFRGSDYALHCELGGHPTREGSCLLPNHTRRLSWLLPFELAAHGASIYDYVTVATARLGYTVAVRRENFAALGLAVSKWRSADRLREHIHDLRDESDG